MQDALELMNKINWFLKPVKELILFLFTTKTGLILLAALFLLIPLSAAIRELRNKALLREAARKRSFITIWEALGTFFRHLLNTIAKLISNFTVLLVIIILLIAVVGLSSAFDAVNGYVKKQEEISNLQTVLKNLNKSYEVARVNVLDYDYLNNETTLEIKFYDYLKKGYGTKKQTITLKGRDIYIQFLVLNFEYSKIENGEKINLAVPIKIFSEAIASKDAIPLQTTDSLGVPYIFKRNEKELYGVDKDSYDQILLEIANYMQDPEAARKAGVRSFTANSTHVKVYKGMKYKILVEQTGGIVLKRIENW